jgi:hypothetical protein
MQIRSAKYLKAARGRACTLRIPGVCNWNPETTVSAHSNLQRHGKGMGIKAHDIFSCHACSNCHSAIDGHLKTDYSKEELQDYWQRGFEETLLRNLQDGVLKL